MDFLLTSWPPVIAGVADCPGRYSKRPVDSGQPGAFSCTTSAGNQNR